MRSVLVIAGASGAGKTTVATRLIEKLGGFELVRSITTRAPRGDSHDGEYIYTDRANFLNKVQGGELLEYMEYGDNLYGTPASEIERIFAEGKIPLLILDIEGVKSLRSKKFDFTPVIFYIWGKLDDIERRLYARDLSEPTAEKLLSFIKRKEMNIRDYLSMPDIEALFDAFIENTGIEETTDSVNKAFVYFNGGGEKDFSENRRVAQSLFEMASSH